VVTGGVTVVVGGSTFVGGVTTGGVSTVGFIITGGVTTFDGPPPPPIGPVGDNGPDGPVGFVTVATLSPFKGDDVIVIVGMSPLLKEGALLFDANGDVELLFIPFSDDGIFDVIDELLRIPLPNKFSPVPSSPTP
jgi:hypothetical protein